MPNNHDLIYSVLMEIVAAITRNFNSAPIIYGSLGVELALNQNYDAHDIDLLLPDIICEDPKLLTLMRKQGYKKQDKPYLAFVKNGIEVEIAKWSYWVKTAGFISEPDLHVQVGGQSLTVLSLKNQWNLYKYLVNHSLRSDVKRQRDQQKLHDLGVAVKQANEGRKYEKA